MREFLLNYPTTGFIMMAIFVVIGVGLLKAPIKHFTNKIQDKKKKDAFNTIFTILLFGIGYAIEWLYSYLISKPFDPDLGFILACAGSGTYSVYEIPKKWVLYLVDCIKKHKQPKQEDIVKIAEETMQQEDNQEITSTDLDKEIKDFEAKLK